MKYRHCMGKRVRVFDVGRAHWMKWRGRVALKYNQNKLVNT